MPTNIVDIPLLNPIRLVPVSAAIINFDSILFRKTIRDYEQDIEYMQKWVFGDTIYLQVLSNFAPVQLDLLRCDGTNITTYNFTVKGSSIINPTMVIYECSISVPVVAEGQYYFMLKVGSDATLETFISEPQYFSDDPTNTVFFRYKHTFNKFDVIFQTGIEFGFRCDGSRGKILPQSKTTVWEDQPLNLKIIDSIPYKLIKLNIGGRRGVPDWAIDKVNRILSCNITYIDDWRYTVENGAKWEPIEADAYPMRGWKIDIRETQNRYSLRGQNNFSPAEQFAVVYNIESKVFGTFNGNASNNIIQVTKAE